VIGDEPIARRLETFQASIGAETATATPGGSLLSIGDGVAVFAGVGSPLTQAIGVDRDVERIEQFYFERDSASIIQAHPWSPREFTDTLASRGYRIVEFENVFGIEIRAAAETATNIDVRESDDIATWARVSAEAFANEEMSVEFLVDVMTPFARAEHACCYIAYIEGEPAGAATMFSRSDLGVAGFFGAGTLTRFRNRGVQTALLRRRMADAAAAGCEIGIVTTQPGSASHRNVARRGFDVLYTKVTMRLDMPRRNA